MTSMHFFLRLLMGALAVLSSPVLSQQLTTAGQPAELNIRIAGEHSVRITLKPLNYKDALPFSPGVAERAYPAPVISLRTLARPVRKKVGAFKIEYRDATEWRRRFNTPGRR